MIQTEEQIRHEALLGVARKMMIAARTAPKARGFDNLEIKMVEGSELTVLADIMRRMATENPAMAFMSRDAANLESAGVAMLIGTKNSVMGLNCGYCGFATCGLKHSESAKTPCASNSHDLGIAIGSAVSVAADNRVDNRVMFSVGVAAIEAGFMDNSAMVMGIPISASGKSPFFDRQPH